jgi:hypothetical protein
MKGLIKVAGLLLTLISLSVSAETATTSWDLSSGGGDYGAVGVKSDGTTEKTYNYGTGYNNIRFVSDDILLKINGWSDTGCGDYCGDDDEVSKGQMYYWGDAYGWGLVNKDEETDYYDHSIDNADDYDMVLLSFSEAVTLEGIQVGWSMDTGSYRGDGETELVAMSLPDEGHAGVNGRTWDTIFDKAEDSALFVDSAPIDGYYQANTSDSLGSSKYWLVGLANFALNCWDDLDGFKLMGVTAKVTEVSEPSMFVLFAVALGFLVRRQRIGS